MNIKSKPILLIIALQFIVSCGGGGGGGGGGNTTAGDDMFMVRENDKSLPFSLSISWRSGDFREVRDIAISPDGNTVYAAGGQFGFGIIDVSTPTSPERLGSYDADFFYNQNFALSSDANTAYVTDNRKGTLVVMDVQDHDNPSPSKSYSIDNLGIDNLLKKRPYDVALSDDNNTAYVVYRFGDSVSVDHTYGLAIIDLTQDPGNQTIETLDITGEAKGIAVVSSASTPYAYIAAKDAGIHIINVSTLTPQPPATYGTTGEAYDIKISSDGNTAYVADKSNGLQILDISSPEVPTALGLLAGGTAEDADSVTLSSDGNTAYLAALGSGVLVIDITDSTAPHLLRRYATSDPAVVIAVATHNNTEYAFVGGGLGGDFMVLDLSIDLPSHVIGSFDSPGDAQDVVISADENTAYIADGDAGLQIVDISNPEQPGLISTYDDLVIAHRVKLSADEKTAYVVDKDTFHIIDITNPKVPVLTAKYEHVNDNGFLDLAISHDGNTAYITGGYRVGVLILDISTPTAPVQIGKSGVGTNDYLALSNDESHVFYTKGTAGFYSLDVSDPTSLTVTPKANLSFWNGHPTKQVTLSPDGNTAYVNAGTLGVDMIDISTPGKHTLLSTFINSISTEQKPDYEGLTLSSGGGIAYVTMGTGGLVVADVSTLTEPSAITKHLVDGEAVNVKISADGNTAYIAASDEGLQIIDLTAASQYNTAGFDTDSINLVINNTANATLGLSISTDRSDIISIGDYDTELSSSDYDGTDIVIPIQSVSGASGVTEITLTLSNGNTTSVRTISYHVN